MAIARFVVAVDIDAVERPKRRRVAHVGDEILEAEPAFADANAASAVPNKGRIIWIETPLKHIAPAPIDARRPAASGVTVRHQMVALQAPVTAGKSAAQMGSVDDALATTIADADPNS